MNDNEKMDKLNDLHEQAMEYMDLAFIERRKGNKVRAKEMFRKSFEFERATAKLLEKDVDFEPTRSVLYRSAATLAVDCGEIEEAKKLISIGLLGNTPIEIADELKELLNAIKTNDLTYTDSSLSFSYALFSQEEEENRIRSISRNAINVVDGYVKKVAMFRILFLEMVDSLS